MISRVSRRGALRPRNVLALGVAASLGASVLLAQASNAADGTGVYAAWTLDTPPTTGEGTFPGTVFSLIALSSSDASLGVAKSATLSGSTPFGEVFGSSRGQQYITSAVASGKDEGSLTMTFTSAQVPGTWGFVLGDVDAEDIKLSAEDASGNPVDVRGWEFTAFNYAGESDLPQWTLETERILGNGSDTSGASMWVRPTTEVASITLTQVKLSGFPQYQLWVAADVLTEADVQEVTVPDSECKVTDTALDNGGFEFPAIPAKSYRQLPQRDVPGWSTTATDNKIEIWSSGFQGVAAGAGNQFAELNATQPSELYQVVDTIPGETLTWSLLHRARAAGANGDTMSVNIGAEGAAPNATYTFTDNLTAGWVRHTGDYTVPEGQTRTRFGFESGATASGSKSVGNFLDDIYFTTTECIPAEVTGGEKVQPEDSVSPSPSASVEASASPSASVSPSASTSTSPSSAASPSASASPTPIAASATSSPTPAPTLTSNPGGPVAIEVVDLPEVPKGSVITDVEQPTNGTIDLRDGEAIFTPKPGFIGEETITVIVRTPEGTEQETTITVSVGKEQTVITKWTAPKKLVKGSNRFGPGTFITNANQVAKVSAKCSILQKWVSPNPDPVCTVTVGKEGTYINVKVYEPTAVEVVLTAPKKGNYKPMKQSYVYRVNP